MLPDILGLYSLNGESFLPSDLVKSCRREIGHENDRITLKFNRRPCSTDADAPVDVKRRLENFNTLRPRQNEQHFADDIFKRILSNENVWILIKISLKFVPKGPINNIPALVQIMAWRRSGDKPLSEPMMVSLLTYICVTGSSQILDFVRLYDKTSDCLADGRWGHRKTFKVFECNSELLGRHSRFHYASATVILKHLHVCKCFFYM